MVAVAASLAVGAAYQWIHHVRDADEAEPVIKHRGPGGRAAASSSASASTSTAWR